MKLERRAVATEIRAVSEDGMAFSGMAALFDSRTYIGPPKKGFFEQIAPGAFDAVLKANPDVRALFNHDPNQLLGRTSSGTLRLESRDDGLYDEIDLPDTTTGRDVAALVRRGDITGQSFTFVAGKDQWSAMPGGHAQLRTITEFDRVVDVSPVTFPAYTDTSAAVRSADALVDAASEKRDRSPAVAYVAAADAALDAAAVAVAAGNVAQASDLLCAASAACSEAYTSLYYVDTDLLESLGLPDVCGMVAAACDAVYAAKSSFSGDSGDPTALQAAANAVDALMVALRIPDPDDAAVNVAEGSNDDQTGTSATDDAMRSQRHLGIIKAKEHTRGHIVNQRRK